MQVHVSNNSTFTGKSATDGGALAVGGDDSMTELGNLTISNSTLQANRAFYSGGALYVTGAAAVLVTAGSLIRGNSAVTGGGFFAINTALVSESRLQ